MLTGFNIEGSKEYIDSVIKELKLISGNIKEQKCEIQQPGMAPYITSDNGKLLITSLETRHQVKINIFVDLNNESLNRYQPNDNACVTISSDEPICVGITDYQYK